MKAIVLDKIASVTLNCRLAREVRLGNTFPCREGDVVAVRVLTRKSSYNTLELTTGRFSALKPGDIVAGALGHRRALAGYAGRIPDELSVGDRVHLLNLGGVLGICTSVHPDLGPPFECEVLGQVLHFPYLGERIGVPANIAQGLPLLDRTLEIQGTPVIAVLGTSMNAGKTQACQSLVQEFAHRGLVVHAGKATGVSLRRDILGFEDAGAAQTSIFTDLGCVTTSGNNAASLACTLLNRLSTAKPDLLVLELGDGLMGEYGVDRILETPELRGAFAAVVFAANDPVGVWGGMRILEERYGLKVTVVTGPATDNAAGTDLIRDRMHTPAFNARTHPRELAAVVLEALETRGTRFTSRDGTPETTPAGVTHA